MPKYHRVKQTFVLLSAVVLLASMTGCSQKIIDRADLLSNDIKIVCNHKLEESDSKVTIENFELIGADVIKSSFDFDVYFNGVSSHSNSSVGYTTLGYEVPSSYFENVDKRSSYEALFDIFEKIIKECEPVNVEVSPVPSISEINNAFIQNEVSPFEKYNISSGLLYNLGTPVFDDSQNKVSFETKTLVELTSRRPNPGFGLGVGFNGKVGFGYGISVTEKEGTFTLQDSYSFVVDDETYEAMKKDPTLVYAYCAKAIQNKDETKISAERISTTSVAYDNADLLKKLSIEDLERDASK